MIKQVFIFVGLPMTGKTTLGRLLNKQNVLVLDDLPNLKGIKRYEGIKRRFNINDLETTGCEYIVYITNTYKDVDYITRKFLPDIHVSVCKFEEAFIKEN